MNANDSDYWTYEISLYHLEPLDVTQREVDRHDGESAQDDYSNPWSDFPIHKR